MDRSSQVPFLTSLSHQLNNLNTGNFGVCRFWLRQGDRRLWVKASWRGVPQIFWANTTHNPSWVDIFCLCHHLSRLAETRKKLLFFGVMFSRCWQAHPSRLKEASVQCCLQACRPLYSHLQATLSLTWARKKNLFRQSLEQQFSQLRRLVTSPPAAGEMAVHSSPSSGRHLRWSHQTQHTTGHQMYGFCTACIFPYSHQSASQSISCPCHWASLPQHKTSPGCSTTFVAWKQTPYQHPCNNYAFPNLFLRFTIGCHWPTLIVEVIP